MRAWLTPDRGSGATICRPLIVPVEYQPLINGALELLAETWNWEAAGDIDVNTAVTDMRAVIDAYYAGDCDMGSPAPTSIRALWWDLQKMAGNSLAEDFTSTQPLGLAWYQSPNAVNDQMRLSFTAGDGTYLLTMKGITRQTCGITTVKLDGVSVGTIDWYSSGTGIDVDKTLSFSIDVGGFHTLDFVAATKNASATAYRQEVTLISLNRTGD